jgi:hypothetical protein
VAKYLHGLSAFDEEGLFLVDGSYLFVPDNKAYEKSVRLRFDEHNHPLSKDECQRLTEREKAKTRWRRCYRSVFLMHLAPKGEGYPLAGFALMGGKEAETPQLRALVDRFVSAVGEGVMKTVVFDRGFIHGKAITHLKEVHGIDSVFPLRSDMLDAKDALVLAEEDEGPWVTWRPSPRPSPKPRPDRPEVLSRREKKRRKTRAARGLEAPRRKEKTELKLLPTTGLWEELKVPLWIVVCRSTKPNGEVFEWCLAITREPSGPEETYELYQRRPAVEERIRQTKCFWDLSHFRSRSFSLVTAQVTFVLLAYSLLQAFFRRVDRGEMNAKTRQRILDELRWEDDRLILYSGNRFTYLTPLEYTRIVLDLPEGARRRVRARAEDIEKSLLRRPPLDSGMTREQETD